MASWFNWSEPHYRTPRRDPADVVTDTLMLELSWQLKEAGRQQRERENEYRRMQTGVDYSWLVNTPRGTFDISAGERLGLEDLCSKIHPPYCGAIILRFRQAVVENEPEVQEMAGLLRSVLLEALERMREEEEGQRLARQWSSRRAMSSMSLMSFKSRVRINPFGSTMGLTSSAANQGTGFGDLKTVSEDVEKGQEGPEKAQRVWSMPDFRHKGLSGKVV
ncbi:protein RD3 [Hypomesus transpacificus]|uniref:protein RD3 n=1 Tax=Hypomesus transpacificus TaxID=137520 RepID=UPI001F07B1CD|nr:protein RD3 [Hypomesus transpacificus]